jgi:hypothetical protein
MRDKDSQLIFENYRNRVIVNETAALAIGPAVAGLDTAIAAIAGTAAGAVILNQIYEAWKTLSPSAQSEFEKDIEVIKSAMTSEDDSFRSTYETLNAIQNVTNDVSLKEIVKETKNYLKTLNHYQDVVEGDPQILTQLAQDYQPILDLMYNFAKKQSATTGDLGVAAIRALDKANQRLADIIDKQQGGGGSNEPPPEPPKGGKGGIIGAVVGGTATVVASFWKEIKSLILKNKKTVAFLVLLTCPQLAGWITGRTKEAGEEALQGIVGDEAGKPKPASTPKPSPKPTPKQGKFAPSRYIPEGEDESPSNPPKASPTPYRKKGNW